MPTTSVTSGVTSSGLTLGNGDDLYVSSGGSAVSTTVSSGGTDVVSAGGTASFTTVSSGGYEVVSSGGTASFTTVSNGGTVDVFAGGTTDYTTLSQGGVEYVYSGGTTSNTSVGYGLELLVGSATAISTTVDGRLALFGVGDLAIGTTVHNGGIEEVVAGTASNTTVSSGGTEVVYAGGTAISTTVALGGTIDLADLGYFPVGTASVTAADVLSVTVGTKTYTQQLTGDYTGESFQLAPDSGGDTQLTLETTPATTIYRVTSGVTSSGLTLGIGHYLYVSSGGSAVSTTVSSGGTAYVSSGGTVSFTAVSSGGTDIVSAGGTASFTTVSSGGYEGLSSGGTASFTTVSNGGTVDVFAGGATDYTTLSQGGVEYVYSGGTTSNTSVGYGLELLVGSATAISTTVDGRLALFGVGDVAIGTTVYNGGIEEVVAGTASNTTVSSGGTEVVYAGGTAISTTVALGGTIDLADLGYVSGGTASVTADDVLSVTVGGNSYTQQLAGNYPGEWFQIAPDSGGDTQLTLEVGIQAAALLCFLAGTLILTDRGEVAVEKLQTGDTITTSSGQQRRLSWIGQGRVLATRGRRGAATPVIVRKGALSDNVPHHDLHITKGHSLYLDGVLIPVEYLINHRMILWDDRAQEVAVYHLELDTHDVLLANGAPAESYRDDGNRWLFRNANTGWDAPPKPPCAVVLTGGNLVDTVWRRLLERCGPRASVPMTDDPDLHLMVDGRRVDATERAGNASVFTLPDRFDAVRIVSRAVVPQEQGFARDPRCLGVALRRVVVRQATRFRVTEANDPRLVQGFHAFEADNNFVWTDGDAALPIELLAEFAGPVEIVLLVACSTQYVEHEVPRRAAGLAGSIAPRPSAA